MYNVKKLKEHIEDLESAVATLIGLKRYTLQDVETNQEVAWSIEHGLQVAVQNLLDIGSHILAAEGINDYEDYTELIDRLGERGILPEAFARSIRGMASFRNVLVHEYIRVDIEQVYTALHQDLEDFTQFSLLIQRHLSQKGISLLT